MFTPNKLGEMMNPIGLAHIFQMGWFKKPTNQLTTNLPVWSCRQVRKPDLLPPSITSQNPKKSVRNRPPNREGL